VDISLSKLPWWGQLGAFVVLAALTFYLFDTYYVTDFKSEMALRKTHLTALKGDITKGIATARRLPEFQAQVTDLGARLESLRSILPEQKDVADTLRRLQGLAAQSNLSLLRFTPAAQRQLPQYAEVPYRMTAVGNFHNLALFFDRVSKFPRIISIGDIAMTASPRQDANSTIVADMTATTFVLTEGAGGRGGRGAPPAR
jgi:type IV pilus assembly protein PilO